MQLNDKTFLLFAAKHYDTSNCTGVEDFEEDISRLKYVGRLIRRYRKSGKLNQRLIMNHCICLFNMFGKASVPLLFFTVEPELWPQLKTILFTLDYITPNQDVLDGINESQIPLDLDVIKTLRT